MRLDEEGRWSLSAICHRRQPDGCAAGRAGPFPAAGGRTRIRARAPSDRDAAASPSSTRRSCASSDSPKGGDFERFIAADNEFQPSFMPPPTAGYLVAGEESQRHIDRLQRLHLPSPGKAHDIVRDETDRKGHRHRRARTKRRRSRTHLSGTDRAGTDSFVISGRLAMISEAARRTSDFVCRNRA